MNNEPYRPFAHPPQEPQESTPAQVPTPADTSNFVVPAPAKKPSKAPLVTAIILGVLLLAAIGTIVYLMYFQPAKSTAPTTQINTQQSTAPEDKAAAVVEKVRTAVNDQLKDTYKDLKLTNSTAAPMYNAPNTDYAVFSSDFGTALSVDPGTTTFDQTTINAIERVVTQTLDDQAGLHSSTQAWQKTYQNDAVICTTSIGSSPVSLSCANTKDYTDLIAQVKPFFEAYIALKDMTETKSTAFSTPIITKKANGYSSATVSIGSTKSPVGGFAGLFYAKDSNWFFWKGTQGILACSDYNSVDLQHAFEGTPCFDAKDDKAVVKITL